MNLINITLKKADLGNIEWENVEKLQPGKNGFICFVSYTEKENIDADGNAYTTLVGDYFETGFNYRPSYKEIINFLISSEYPDGKEQEMLRLGIRDPQNEEYLEYFNKAEEIRMTIKSLLS